MQRWIRCKRVLYTVAPIHLCKCTSSAPS
uniref:Uncharacterized protein n=1 Tax=Anguilla anguilla TaxID=7936 RepID=A0A0E9W6L0_ANGAN